MTSWEQVSAEDRQMLISLVQLLLNVVQQLGDSVVPDQNAGVLPTPGEVALRLHEMGNRLFSTMNPDEQDLRQIITTLRTALTVGWDMYDRLQAERTTVQQHMERLRRSIEEFEADLNALQAGRELEQNS